jgi:lipoate-protein ligase A
MSGDTDPQGTETRTGSGTGTGTGTDGDSGAPPVDVYRGRAPTVEADLTATAAALDRAGETARPCVRVWSPARQVAFGRRDRGSDGYEAAVETAEARGFPAVERSVGGRAVAYTGTTVAFAHAVPLPEDGSRRTGIDLRYDDALDALLGALMSVGVDATPGEPPGSYCPGSHSVQAPTAGLGGGVGKLAGVAQRVRQDAALVAGVVVVSDRPAIANVLAPVYDTLGVPFDRSTVGGVVAAGGPSDPTAVARALEDALVGDRDRRVSEVDALVRADADAAE